MEKEFKRAVILEHYQNPRNKGLISDNSYKKINTNSESCIDEIDIMLKIENNIITDIKYDGEACAICTSTTSIMTELLIGKTLQEANEIIDNYNNMIDEKEYNKELLKEAVAYEDISKQPNRKKCSLLTWQGVKKLINEEK